MTVVNLKKLFKLTSIATLLVSGAMGVQAETTGYDQISFTSEAKTEVANDQMLASMYHRAQAKTAKELAIQLNDTMNKAMKIAKRYPNVEVSTGQHSTYPKYDKEDNIVGWTGQADINLKSTHLEDASQLIADLQNILVLNNLQFGVSESKQDKIKEQLLTAVAKRFQQRAETISRSWGATSYRIVNVGLNTGHNYYSPVNSYRASMKTAGAPEAQNFQSGNSKISVTASGTIELVR